MNDKYNKISREFINFKTTLNQEIKNTNPKFSINNECYCIKEKWFNEFEAQINQYNTNKKSAQDSKNNNLKVFLSKNHPEFINDIDSAVKIFEGHSNIKIISKNLVILLCDKEKILNYNSVKFYAGNNKIILEFNIYSDVSISLLIISPLEELSQQVILYFPISNKREFKMKFYKTLIENEVSNKSFSQNKIDFKKINITDIRSPINLKQNQSLDSKSSQPINLIIKFLISLYYYEISLSNNKNKESIININERSYLINPEWIEAIKSFYKYQDLINIINNNIKKAFDYSNFFNQIDQIFEIIINKSEIQKIPTSTDIFKTENIIPKEKREHNLSFLEKCYILPKKIILIIKTFISHESNSLRSVSHFWKNNHFCILKNCIIYIGIINSSTIFLSEYILFYKNIENIPSDEFKSLLNVTNINKFFSERKCNDNTAYIQKIYLKSYNGSIGKLFILKNREHYLNSYINKVEVKKEKKHNRSSSMDYLNITHNQRIINNEEKENISEINGYKKVLHTSLNKSMQEDRNIQMNNFLMNRGNEENKENSLQKQYKEKKENEMLILIKQNEKYKFQINQKENEINQMKNLNDKLNLDLKLEKEKNKKLEEIIRNLEQKMQEKKEADNNISINNNKKDEQIKNLLSLNKNLETEKKALEEKVQKYKNRYEQSKTQIENKEIKQKERENEKENAKEKELLEMQKEINEKIKFLENKEMYLCEEENRIEKRKEKLNKDNNKENQILKQKNKELLEINDLLKKDNEKMKSELEEMRKQMKNKDSKPKNNISQSLRIDEINNNNNINYIDNNYIEKNNEHKRRSNSMPNQIKKKPLELFLKPTLIGLDNLGATCFMNSTLQCLSQTGALTNYFLAEKNESYINRISTELSQKKELCLSKVYLWLIKKLWEKNPSKPSFSPKKFMDTIAEMNPLFKKGDPGDAKDFIIFVLEQIHKELKRSIANNANILKIEDLNQYDKVNAFSHFFEEFKKDCSIISDVFFGFNETTNVCLNCKNNYTSKGQNFPICYNYGIFNCLIFPLEEVRKMKCNYYKINCDRVNLIECFVYNQQSELFTGENQNYCNICRQMFNSVYTSLIYTFPNHLILILNRGKGNVFKVNLDFALQIDLTDFAIAKQSREIFDLYGVITHIGQSGPNAHFVATCKSPIDGYWYRYNDSLVNPITDIQKEIINFGVPYILFYQKHPN